MNEWAWYINKKARRLGINPVCYLCKKKCKQPYTFWSFQMPPHEYCDKFESRLKDLSKGEEK